MCLHWRDQAWHTLVSSFLLTPNDRVGRRDTPSGFPRHPACESLAPNTVITRIPPLGPIVFWFVLDVSNPHNRFDILQSKFHPARKLMGLGGGFPVKEIM